jgi:hypothetical protein
MVLSFLSDAILRGDDKRELWGYLDGFYIEFRRRPLSRRLRNLSKIITASDDISSRPARLPIKCVVTTQGYTMSRLVAKILLAIFMLPLAVIVYGLTVMFIEQWLRPAFSSRNEEMVLFDWAGFVMWVFVAVYWFMLWRNSVRWSRERHYKTLGLAVGLIGFVTLIEIALAGSPNAISIVAFFGSIVAPLLWLIGTVIFWQETPTERSERRSSPNSISCPICGYNLTGLTESRCPECGTKFTLDELLTSQPTHPTRELD